MYRDDEQGHLPGVEHRPRTGCRGKLHSAHAQLLTAFIEKNPAVVLADIRCSLCEAFSGLAIPESALHWHLVDKCCLTLKKLEKLHAARNTDRVVALRAERVAEREQIAGLGYATNCVFIDEAGFNLHTQRNFGRSLRGTPAKGMVPTARGISVTILGAISSAGVIDVSQRKPEAVSAAKKRKVTGREVRISGHVGTRTEHFLAYLPNAMGMLDARNMKGLCSERKE